MYIFDIQKTVKRIKNTVQANAFTDALQARIDAEYDTDYNVYALRVWNDQYVSFDTVKIDGYTLSETFDDGIKQYRVLADYGSAIRYFIDNPCDDLDNVRVLTREQYYQIEQDYVDVIGLYGSNTQ